MSWTVYKCVRCRKIISPGLRDGKYPKGRRVGSLCNSCMAKLIQEERSN